MCITAAMTEA